MRGRDDRILHFFYLGFFAGLFFSWRAVSSISIGFILLYGVFIFPRRFPWRLPKPILFFTAACVDCFLLSAVSLLYTNNEELQWEHVRLQSGLVIIPIAVLLTMDTIGVRKRKLLVHYTLILVITCLYCLVRNEGIYFYHGLVAPVRGHAVYFSLFVLIALLFLLDEIRSDERQLSRLASFGLILFLSIFLALLSSRFVITCYIIYLFVYLIGSLRSGRIRKRVAAGAIVLLVAGIVTLFFTNNPVSRRFNDIVKVDLQFIKKERFDPDDYFNGVQLRALEWRIVSSILDENEAWVIGITAGDAQQALNEEYTKLNMYMGEKNNDRDGYGAYNTHNQFLQSVLHNGWIGVIVFLLCFVVLIELAVKSKRRNYAFLIIVLLLYACIESVLETQYGIVLFCFFPLFLYPLSKTGTKQTFSSDYPIK